MDEYNLPDLVEMDDIATIPSTLKLPRTVQITRKSWNSKKVVIKCPLTTKNAVKYLLEGTLKTKVCRYCLNVATALSELDQILHVAGSGTTYKVTIRDIIASFHPFKVADDPNFPNKICNRCLDIAIKSYLFTQQCERAERALRNCFDDIYEKVDKLDPLERKKRGRQKLHPNYNIIRAEHKRVIDYAEPIRHIVNSGAEPFDVEPAMTELECTRCWQVLPDMESLINHVKIHPNTMWHHCRLCGQSFPKLSLMKKHYYRVHMMGRVPKMGKKEFRCSQCAHVTENYKDHLQHIEKHKFKNVMKHLVDKKLHQLCTVCLDKSAKLVDTEDMVCIHGGYPELMGDTPLFRVLASTLPDINKLPNFLGTKVCDKCLNNAITAYIFINQFSLSRERLDFCVSHMLKSLENVSPNKGIFVEINEKTIMPLTEEFDETLLLDENDDIDESKIKINVLEDEFRIISDSESSKEDEAEPANADKVVKLERPDIKVKDEIKSPEYDQCSETNEVESPHDLEDRIHNLANKATKTYSKRKVNGLQYTDVCSEFLTFNNKTSVNIMCKAPKSYEFTCPLCKKKFISDYFLKRHVAKHVNKSVRCDICSRDFQSKFQLREHKKVAHLMKATQHYCCEDCGRTFIKEMKYRSHQKQHKRLECQFCGKAFASQTYYNSHLERHTSKLNYFKRKRPDTCSFCEKECPNRTKLSIHINKVHFEIKPYSCDMCDRKFYAEYNMNRHRRLHSMISKENCAFCNKIFKSRKSLVNHVREHIGAKPFSCPVCNVTFHSQFKVKQHMKVYHGGIFCCSMCKTTFMTKKGLKNHIENDHRLM